MNGNYPKQISNSVFLLGNHYFQSYLVRGESCAFVEGGVSWSATQIVEQLKEMGIAPEELQYLIILHAHFDHVCGVPGLKEDFPQLQILASETAAKVLGKEKVIAGFFKENFTIADNLRNNSEGLKSLPLAYRLTDQGADQLLQPPATIAVDKVVNEGDKLDLGKGSILEFSMLPGHSPCSMAAYLPSEQVLFPSDSWGYLIDQATLFPMYFSGYQDYVNSLQRLSQVEAAVLATPHELVASGGKEIEKYLRWSQDSTEELNEFILKEYRRGCSREEISRVLFHKYYQGAMAYHSEENIMLCSELLVRRTLETITDPAPR